MPFINIFKGRPKPKQDVEVRKTPSSNLPQSVTTEYKPNLQSFYNWSEYHRDHQELALEATDGETIGQISLPTGTGKTRVQVALHVKEMIEYLQRGEYSVFAISAHRLALCSQLLEDLIVVAVNAGIPFDILFVGSARFPEDKIHARFRNQGFNRYVNEAVSTTRGKEVEKAVRKAHLRKRHVICVSTYHSFDKLAGLNEIAICTYDEAHVVIANNFLDNIMAVRPIIQKNFFFTATRRVQGASEGMNNKEVFGEVLFELPPRDLIEAGEIVPPKLHIIQTEEEGDYNNHTMLVNTVITGFEQHRVLVKEVSCDPGSIGAKLMITTTGNMEMGELHEDEGFRSFCWENNIQVFAFSSERGSFVNFEPNSRDSCMQQMRDLGNDEDAILLHIDILTEGIDLPSITGVMPFRELNTLKLLQTIGRSARLLNTDRQRLYGGELVPCDWDNYIKPCCWVIFPELFRSLGNPEAMKDVIRKIVNEYDVPVEEYNVIEQYLAPEDDEQDRITKRDRSSKRDKESELVHIIEDVMLEKFNSMTGKRNPLDIFSKLFK